MSETITGVAVLTKDGELWSLPKPNRHCHIFALAAFTGRSAEPGVQGFTTDAGRFVDRQEAASIFASSGKLPINGRKYGTHLYSEDLW
jgi:hypothetical protein